MFHVEHFCYLGPYTLAASTASQQIALGAKSEFASMVEGSAERRNGAREKRLRLPLGFLLQY